MKETIPFEWDGDFKLGYAPMDEVHEEFVAIVREMRACADDALVIHLRRFEVHARDHFDQERHWMRVSGFPAAECHIAEHDAVMRSVDEVLDRVLLGGPAAEVRRLAEALAHWFPAHADYLDAALAQWLVKQTTQGVPVVFRRKESIGRRGVRGGES
ncbi:bacteriohemerythrin [Paraburkholderia silvatlantica]|uniref:bacteriohemerythrin n=1 Tax=Paraburkholderia silvatlantica TaxID=321895 RepID=UPI0037503ABD